MKFASQGKCLRNLCMTECTVDLRIPNFVDKLLPESSFPWVIAVSYDKRLFGVERRRSGRRRKPINIFGISLGLISFVVYFGEYNKVIGCRGETTRKRKRDSSYAIHPSCVQVTLGRWCAAILSINRITCQSLGYLFCSNSNPRAIAHIMSDVADNKTSTIYLFVIVD